MLKAVVFSGHEKTYQAWNGVPVRYLDSSDASLRTYNSYTYETIPYLSLCLFHHLSCQKYHLIASSS